MRKLLLLTPALAAIVLLLGAARWLPEYAYGYDCLSTHHPFHRQTRSPAGGGGYTYSKWQRVKRWKWVPGPERGDVIYVTAYAELADRTTVTAERLFATANPTTWPPEGDITSDDFEAQLGRCVDRRTAPPWYSKEIVAELFLRRLGAK